MEKENPGSRRAVGLTSVSVITLMINKNIGKFALLSAHDKQSDMKAMKTLWISNSIIRRGNSAHAMSFPFGLSPPPFFYYTRKFFMKN